MTDEMPSPIKRSSPLVLWGIFLGCFLIRLFLPIIPNHSMHYYSAVGWAVVSGENWGKQAVIGVMEYSPLPAILLLLLSPLSYVAKLGLHAGRVLPAVGQALTLVTLFAVSGEFFKRWWSRALVAVAATICMGWGLDYQMIPGNGLLVADPFWAIAPPALIMTGFAARMKKVDSVRPLLIFSLAASMLVFAGPAGFILAFAGMATLLVYGQPEIRVRGGTPLLSMMPLGYALILALLFNLVIMSNAFFFIQRLLPYFSDARSALPSLTGWKLIAAVAWALTVGIALMPNKGLPFFVRFAWVQAIAFLPIFLLRRGGRVFIGGESILAGVVIVALTLALVTVLTARGMPVGKGLLAIVTTLVLLASVVVLKRHAHAFEPFVDSDRPSPDQILSYLDDTGFNRWEGSRVLVFGSRASALYCIHNDVTEKDRFIGNVDFNVHVLLEHAEVEQLHLLIPPDNGAFYPQGSFFSQIHNRDLQEDWLMYETEWNGWQLWRCVRSRPQPGSFPE